jgi:hypothetical protein
MVEVEVEVEVELRFPLLLLCFRECFFSIKKLSCFFFFINFNYSHLIFNPL